MRLTSRSRAPLHALRYAIRTLEDQFARWDRQFAHWKSNSRAVIGTSRTSSPIKSIRPYRESVYLVPDGV